MFHSIGRTLTALILTCVAGIAPAANPVAKVAPEDPPADLAEPVRAVLDRNAIAVTGGDGAADLTVWFRTTIPAKATAEQLRNGLTLREIPDGSLLAAVRFAKPFVDFRKQDIPAGIYTLRFAVQPETGDHMGTAPHPEFALLSPAAQDATADPLEPKALFKQSAATTGGDHPGVLLLYPSTGADRGPKLAAKGDGVTVLAVRRAAEADGEKTSLGFAIVVAGSSKSR